MNTVQSTAAGAASTATVDRRTACVNIADRLREMASRYPGKPAVVMADGRGSTGAMTFSGLQGEVEVLARGLSRAGVRRGMRTILFVKPGPEFFALTFALFRIGAVPVLIDPGIGRQQMSRCLREVDAQAFIGIPLAHVFRLLYKRLFAKLEVVVTVGRRWCWGGLNLARVRALGVSGADAADDTVETDADDPAAILFTSGSTGPAKGVVYTHGIFDAQVDYLQSHYGYGPEEVDLPTFPLFALFDAALGMTAVIPRMDFTRPGAVDPRRIVAAIEAHGCTHMFGSPALLKRVAAHGVERHVRCTSIKRVITAGAPIPPSVLGDMHRIIAEDGEVFTPYGATESLPVCSIGSREILRETAERTEQGAGTCVGRPLAGIDVRIIPISDTPIGAWSDDLSLPSGEIGEVAVRGPIVTREYWNNASATDHAKIRDDNQIWHRMGDLGWLDGAGRLWFCGRKAHRVVVGAAETVGPVTGGVADDAGGTSVPATKYADRVLFTVPCEAIFNQHPAVARSALVGVPAGNSSSQVAVICVELTEQHRSFDREQLRSELLKRAAQHPHTRPIRHVLVHPRFPVDVRHNAKIFREKLAVWATRSLGSVGS